MDHHEGSLKNVKVFRRVAELIGWAVWISWFLGTLGLADFVLTFKWK